MITNGKEYGMKLRLYSVLVGLRQDECNAVSGADPSRAASIFWFFCAVAMTIMERIDDFLLVMCCEF